MSFPLRCLCQIPEVLELQTAVDELTEYFDMRDVIVFALEFARG